MSKPTPTDSAKERILDAAMKVIAEKGYSAAGVQEIIDRSETSKGSFYFHFPSKEIMVMALVERMSDKLVDRLSESVRKKATPLDRVTAGIETLLTTFARRRSVAQVLMLGIVGNGRSTDRKFLPIRERFSAFIRGELDGAVACGQIDPIDTELVSQMWVGSIYEVLMRWLLTGQPNPLTSATPTMQQCLLQSVGASKSGSRGRKP